MADRNAKYSELSDDELIERLRNGDNLATEYICEKYKRLVAKNANRKFISGADRQDLIQEGMIGLFKAVRDYDPGRDASFLTFANLCVNRQLETAVSNSLRKKHQPLNGAVTLDGENEDGVKLSDIMSDRLGVDPENIVLNEERYRELEKMITEQLSEFERQVWDLYLTGMTYGEIAKALGRSEKATDNALQRLKAKIKKIVSEKKED